LSCNTNNCLFNDAWAIGYFSHFKFLACLNVVCLLFFESAERIILIVESSDLNNRKP